MISPPMPMICGSGFVFHLTMRENGRRLALNVNLTKLNLTKLGYCNYRTSIMIGI
jgi:hypothetical protein